MLAAGSQKLESGERALELTPRPFQRLPSETDGQCASTESATWTGVSKYVLLGAARKCPNLSEKPDKSNAISKGKEHA
jgi:hypothetical protein